MPVRRRLTSTHLPCTTLKTNAHLGSRQLGSSLQSLLPVNLVRNQRVGLLRLAIGLLFGVRLGAVARFLRPLVQRTRGFAALIVAVLHRDPLVILVAILRSRLPAIFFVGFWQLAGCFDFIVQ